MTEAPRPARRPRVVAGVVAAALALVGGWVYADRSGWDDPYRSQTTAGCAPAVLPAGQAHPAGEPEPLLPAW